MASGMDRSTYFARLKVLLDQPGLPTQEEIAKAIGVHQSLVSRAATGELVRITDRVRRLRRYAGMRVRNYRRAGLAGPTGSSKPVMGGVDRRGAIAECRSYLEAGFDPRVLRDQVVLLRRAQSLPPTMA